MFLRFSGSLKALYCYQVIAAVWDDRLTLAAERSLYIGLGPHFLSVRSLWMTFVGGKILEVLKSAQVQSPICGSAKVFLRIQVNYPGDRTCLFRTADPRMQRIVSCSLEFLPGVRSSSDCVFDFKLIYYYTLVSMSFRWGIMMTWNCFYVAWFLWRGILLRKNLEILKV